MCLYPKLIQNRKYIANKKNGGIIPAVRDDRVLAVPIGCGRCMECKKKKAREWQVRLLEDVRHNKNGKFVTLTFNNESIKELAKECEGATGYDLDNEIATLGIRRFLERWRKDNKKSIRHWLVTELGHEGTENIHIHGIVWTDKDIKEVEKHWKYGYIWAGTYVSEKTVNYIIKYIHKQDADHKEYKSKILTSAGIGSEYIIRNDSKNNKYKKGETKEYYKTRSGHKIGLTMYWRNKIYTEEEKEKLWLEKLDQQVRWVGGEKIDVSINEDEYYKTVEWYRNKAKRLGYQNDIIDWSRKKYEEDRRLMLTRKRIEEAEKSLRGLGTAPESAESVNNDASVARSKEEW